MEYAGHIHQKTRGKRVCGRFRSKNAYGQQERPQLCRICKSGKRRKTGASALCTMDDESCFLCDPTWPQDVCVSRENHVVSTATSCDVTYCATTLQGFNKHASETMRIPKHPTTVMTANGEVPTREESTYMSKNWTHP